MLWSCGSREKLLSTATAVGRPCSAASTSILSKLWSAAVNPHFTVRVVAEDAAGASSGPSTSPKLPLRNASKSPSRRSVPARHSYSKIAESPCLSSVV